MTERPRRRCRLGPVVPGLSRRWPGCRGQRFAREVSVPARARESLVVHLGDGGADGGGVGDGLVSWSARRANRRSQSRTVVYGTPSSAATWFHGRPRAAASNPAQITSTPYCLRRSIESGSSTRDTPHSARRGRTRPVTARR